MRFQFLGIPPKGEQPIFVAIISGFCPYRSFQFLGIPPKGEPFSQELERGIRPLMFPISRDPPEGGTFNCVVELFTGYNSFPISRDPPEGGTR